MTQYKYRCREVYRDVQLDIKSNDLNDFIEKVTKKKASIDRQILDPNTLLSDFAKLYIETYKKNTVSDGWYRDIKRIVENKIVPGIGDKAVGKIKPIEIQKFLNSCSGLADSHLKKIYDLVCQIFRNAYKNGMTQSDFTITLERPKGRKGETGRSITDNEREVLLKVLRGHRGEMFCKIILYCGLRPSEVSALVWKDIDLSRETIEVNKSRKPNGTIGEPKSAAGYRTVPIPKHFADELRQVKGAPFDLVCVQSNGKPHTLTSIRTMWNNIKRLMNIEMGCKVFRNALVPPLPLADDFIMYNLRHTYCTDLEKAKVPLNVARRLMGHSSILITSKIYTHESDDTLEDARHLLNIMSTKSEAPEMEIPGETSGKIVGNNRYKR